VYHVPRKLEYADYGVVKNLVNISVLLLRAAGEHEKVVLSPIPRYMKRFCDSMIT
jgi:hypothetical protein